MGTSFIAYNSVLSHYPFLSGRSLGAQEMDDRLNLKQLKIQAAARRLSENQLENARICQFEVPGGGECRDADCGDMHLSQLEAEPKGAPLHLILCLSHDGCHLIGWMRVGVGVGVFCLQMTRLRNICAGIRMWRR
jgi:hypothetical protein